MRIEDCDDRELHGCAPAWFTILFFAAIMWGILIWGIVSLFKN